MSLKCVVWLIKRFDVEPYENQSHYGGKNNRLYSVWLNRLFLKLIDNLRKQSVVASHTSMRLVILPILKLDLNITNIQVHTVLSSRVVRMHSQIVVTIYVPMFHDILQ